MNQSKTLIVDDNEPTIAIIVATLQDAQLPYVIVDSNEDAIKHVAVDVGISRVFLRGFGDKILGPQLCGEIRKTKTAEQLPIFVLLNDDQLVSGADFLIAGANDLLVGFFEPRELRMRAGIVPADQIQRIDAAHVKSDSATTAPQFFVPEFNPQTRRFCFGANEIHQPVWEADPTTRKVRLDQIIVCPECESVPTFRLGCGACGSAWVEKEILIHHYACAHVAPEREFVTQDGIACPKCRLSDLVAGSDFEQTSGCLRCTDCDAIFTESRMIGHCLACQHRFSASDGIVRSLYGYEIGGRNAGQVVNAPNYHALTDHAVTAEAQNV